MNREAAITAARAHLEHYLRKRGISAHGSFACLNPAHDDAMNSMRFDKDADRVECFACGASWDLLELMQRIDGARDFNEALLMACERFGIPFEEGAARIKTRTKKRR